MRNIKTWLNLKQQGRKNATCWKKMASYVPNFTLENKIGTSIYIYIYRQRLIVEQLSYPI